MMNKKMTKKDWYQVLIAIVKASDNTDKDGALNFINHELEQLEKKSGKVNGSKENKANDKIKNNIINVLRDNDKPMTISEMLADERLATWVSGKEEKKMSNQKLSAMARQLVNEKLIIKKMDKKQTVFSLPVEHLEVENDTTETETENIEAETETKVEVETEAETETKVEVDFDYATADILPQA